MRFSIYKKDCIRFMDHLQFYAQSIRNWEIAQPCFMSPEHDRFKGKNDICNIKDAKSLQVGSFQSERLMFCKHDVYVRCQRESFFPGEGK